MQPLMTSARTIGPRMPIGCRARYDALPLPICDWR